LHGGGKEKTALSENIRKINPTESEQEGEKKEEGKKRKTKGSG
jgi:hypothetical protein